MRPGPRRLIALLIPLVIATGAVGCVNGQGVDLMKALDVCVTSSDGSLCDDLQPCTIGDVCLNKRCVGTPVADGRPCTDGNVCTGPDQCRAGVCVGTALADGTSCTDDDPCTTPDICQLGNCRSGGLLVCNDNDSCTVDTCVTGVGCLFSPRECAAVVDAAADMSIDLRRDVPAADMSIDLVVVPDVGSPDVPALDTGEIDVPPADDGPESPPDLGSDVGVGPDVGPDLGPPAPDAAPGVDADDGGVAVMDAAGPFDAEPDLSDTPPEFRARGGGCQCGVTGETETPARAPAPALALAALALLWARARPRRR